MHRRGGLGMRLGFRCTEAPMTEKQGSDAQYSDEETERRMNEGLRRALTTPPKLQATVRHPRGKKGARTGGHRRTKRDGASA
jgi:hypothetical protein